MRKRVQQIREFIARYRRIAELIFFLLLMAFLIHHLRSFQTQAYASLLWQKIASPDVVLLLMVLLLMPLNWLLEAWKWQLILKPDQVPLWQALRGTLAGLSLGMITPWRSGELPGRSAFLSHLPQTRTFLLTAWAGAAQTIATLLALLLSAPIDFPPPPFISFLLGCSSSLLLFYLYPQPLFRLLRYPLPDESDLPGLPRLTAILAISLLRLAVYVAQYMLLFHLAGIPADGFSLAATTLQFLAAATFSPLMPLLDPAWRGTAVVLLFPPEQQLAAVFAVGCIWLINLAIPALAGYVFWVRKP